MTTWLLKEQCDFKKCKFIDSIIEAEVVIGIVNFSDLIQPGPIHLHLTHT